MKARFMAAILAAALSTSVHSQELGLGFKLGDPLGITLKKYSDDKAFELVFGRTSYWSRYDYNDLFYRKYKYDSKYSYYGYTKPNPLAIQLHFLKSSELKEVEGLNIYYGGGLQFRFGSIEYHYYYDVFTPGYGWSRVYETDKQVQIDLGLDGVVGLEYTFKDAPVSIFADVNIFLELYDDFFQAWGQGGIGARYNLK